MNDRNIKEKHNPLEPELSNQIMDETVALWNTHIKHIRAEKLLTNDELGNMLCNTLVGVTMNTLVSILPRDNFGLAAINYLEILAAQVLKAQNDMHRPANVSEH